MTRTGLGGEKISLAIEYQEKENFHKAGYANITIGGSEVAGAVRQYDRLSFSRVYDAGHGGIICHIMILS
jgi:carboxypeptidase C (cathepsin A)